MVSGASGQPGGGALKTVMVKRAGLDSVTVLHLRMEVRIVKERAIRRKHVTAYLRLPVYQVSGQAFLKKGIPLYIFYINRLL